MSAPRPLTFHNAGWFFLAIFGVALIGFLPSYFPRPSARPIEFSVYTHVHAALMVSWLALLITQPFLIKHGHHAWHRRLGRVSLVLLPLVMLAMLLLIHHRLGATDMDVPKGLHFFIPLKDIIIIGTTYTLAMVYRRRPAYHARFMVGSCFQLLEPALVRALDFLLPLPSPEAAAGLTWLTIDGILVWLIVKDRHLPQGRWIFRFVLGLTVTMQVFLIAGGPTTAWFTRFTEWFHRLPLT